jgi:hypothetical protein
VNTSRYTFDMAVRRRSGKTLASVQPPDYVD